MFSSWKNLFLVRVFDKDISKNERVNKFKWNSIFVGLSSKVVEESYKASQGAKSIVRDGDFGIYDSS